MSIQTEHYHELAERVLRDADELVDVDPIQLRDLAYEAATALREAAETLDQEESLREMEWDARE